MTKGKIFAIIIVFLCIIAVGTIFSVNVYNSYFNLVQENEALQQENQKIKEEKTRLENNFRKNEQSLIILNM